MKKITLLALFIFLTSCQSNLDKFAMCLNDSGAVMYGSQSCENCREQNEFFEDSTQYLNYVECDKYAKNTEYKTCDTLQINAYPTWIFKDNSYLVGKQTFKALSEKTGCIAPQ